MMSFICALLQILLKEWSTRAYFWTEIMAEPFFTLEATRTLASVTRLCVVLRVSALFMQMIVIFRPYQFNQTTSLFLQGLPSLFFGKTMRQSPVLLSPLEGRLSPTASLSTPIPLEDTWSFTLEATTTDGGPTLAFQVCE